MARPSKSCSRPSSGAPLHNIGAFAKEFQGTMHRWVAQGGFAGDSVVPEESRLAKFAGKETCATFNFGGSAVAAKALLASDRIRLRHLVSKNVCHGIAYDKTLHARLAPHKDAYPGLALVYAGMELYLQNKEKLFYDPFAVCVAINPQVVDFREVQMYTNRNEWGARLAQGTNTFISVKANKEAFFMTLTNQL